MSIFGGQQGTFIDLNVYNDATIGRNETIGGTLTVAGTSTLGALTTGTTFQGTNGNFTNLSGSYSGGQLLAKWVEATNDNSTVVVSSTLGSLTTNSRGLHLGYNAISDVSSIYAMDAAGTATTPLYLNSTFSYGNGAVYMPSLHTDNINEFAGSAGVNVSGLNIDTNVIKSTSGSGPIIESGSVSNNVTITCDNVVKLLCTPTDVRLQSAKLLIDVNGNLFITDDTKSFYFGSNVGLSNTALNFNGSPALTASTLTISGNTALTSSALSFAGVTGLTPTALTISGNTALTSSALSFAGVSCLTPNTLTFPAASGNAGVSVTTSSSGVGNWIGGSFGASGTTRVVLGNNLGNATIGGHNSTFSSWADLYLNSGGGNTHVLSGNYTSANALSVGGSVDVQTGYKIAANNALTSSLLAFGGNTALTSSTLSLRNSGNVTNISSTGTATRTITFPDSSGVVCLGGGGNMLTSYSFASNSTLTTGYYLGTGYQTNLEYGAQTVMTRAGTVGNLIGYAFQGVSGGSVIYTLRINGVDTSVTITITATGNSTSNTAAVVAGDLVSISIALTGSPITYGAAAFEFWG